MCLPILILLDAPVVTLKKIVEMTSTSCPDSQHQVVTDSLTVTYCQIALGSLVNLLTPNEQPLEENVQMKNEKKFDDDGLKTKSIKRKEN